MAMTMSQSPSVAEQQQAVRDGVPVRFGVPVLARCGDGWAACDLVAAAAGHPDPWHVVQQPAPGVVDLQSVGDRGVYVEGLPVAVDDLVAVLRAVECCTEARRRHAPGANRQRREAGEQALRVQDAMVRARLLDAVDGWSALIATGTVLDDDPAHGQLVRPDPTLNLQCHILVVRCPTTGRVYALRVPREQTTARGARLWTMGDEWQAPPEIET